MNEPASAVCTEYANTNIRKVPRFGNVNIRS